MRLGQIFARSVNNALSKPTASFLLTRKRVVNAHTKRAFSLTLTRRELYMPTKKLYMTDPGLYEHKAKVTEVKKDGNGNIVVKFDETIFHPKGGGQPSDQGTVNGVPLVVANKDGDAFDFDVTHVFSADSIELKVGDEVSLKVDQATRIRNSKLHTAGHLIANYANILFGLEYDKCHLYPLIAIYLVFNAPENFKLSAAQQKVDLEAACNGVIKKDLPIMEIEPEGEHLRQVKIGDLKPFPCGGTHTKTLAELCGVSISKIAKQKNQIKITFDVVSDENKDNDQITTPSPKR